MPDLIPGELDLGELPLGSSVAVFGGIYNNWLALQATVARAQARGVAATLFLGDTGGFGPHPERSVELLRASPVIPMAGNYDHSVGNARQDCACGYTDPRDDHFARLSYDYTLAGTSPESRRWLAALPSSLRLRLGGRELLFCHGSPRRQNEFLWESNSPPAFLRYLCQQAQAELIVCTHTGIPWTRRLPEGGGLVNVGAIGRPANDGRTEVWAVLLHARPEGIEVEALPIAYDQHRLAGEMQDEGLPPEFIETIRTGWWTTCLEILPGKERMAGRY